MAKTINKQIEDILDNKKLKYFVLWYTDGAEVKTYDDKVKKYLNVDYDKGMTYLDREDVQAAISIIVKNNKDMNLIRIYNKMLEMALSGDVSCANWVVKFSESSFFKNSKSEFEKIAEGLDLDE